jgi:hypothetical protein
MTVNANELWIGLAVGLLPYRIRRRYLPGGTWTLEVRALFWSVSLRARPSGRHDWTLRLPLVERLRDAAWAALLRLRGTPPPAA